MRWVSAFQSMPVRWRIRLTLLPMTPIIAIAAGWLGLPGHTMAILLGVAAALSILSAWWLEARISRPLEQVFAQALRVASGESQKAVHMNRVDEIGMTLRTISQLGLMFRWLIDDVSEQVINVQTASNEIAQGNADLSGRTDQAASSVRQTVESMAEMTASARRNAETALQANQLAGSASGAAAKGGRPPRRSSPP